ncbi:BTB/POZ domain-containing protein At2g24240-like [Triticum dicoccoides]|uniref:BTB/POZ domain-containing protein At2g24240-like n=1 Tax=Triticum dicoccoides TaxID=85692 RepID=UPI00188F0F9E|nr:BTB/POZ domain-containing protein At2g24240-like [Triticum dicoccoides]
MCTPQTASGRIRLNVGGQVFETTADTLRGAGEGTMLAAMLEPCWNAGATGGVPEYFIDRDPACFASLLNMLRTGELHVPAGVPERMLFQEASYYGLLDRARATRIGELDLSRTRLAASVPPGRAPVDRPAVRAAPDGGCCVTHGPIVRVYNWMLEERQPQTNVFASCNNSGITPEIGYGIGVWDCITGEQTSYFFDRKYVYALTDASKLQWLASTNALMAVKACSPKDAFSPSSITLVDFRDMSVVWSWSVGSRRLDEKHVADAVVMEDERSVRLISQNHDLGFLDIRSRGSFQQPWTYQSKATTPICYPKLAVHGGLLLASKDDTISVYGGPNHDHLRLALRGSQGGGAIADFSVGGDRLFAVHHEDNVLDVWETLPPPIA